MVPCLLIRRNLGKFLRMGFASVVHAVVGACFVCAEFARNRTGLKKVAIHHRANVQRRAATVVVALAVDLEIPVDGDTSPVPKSDKEASAA
jgi:hypothetical protein